MTHIIVQLKSNLLMEDQTDILTLVKKIDHKDPKFTVVDNVRI